MLGQNPTSSKFSVLVLLFLSLFVTALYVWGEKFQIASTEPNYLSEDYKGFKLFEYMGVFYGLNPKEDPQIIKEINTRAEYFWVSYHNMKGVKKKINRYLREGREYDFPREMPHI